MNKIIAAAVLATVTLTSGFALAAQKTVTLAVSGMYCASCPYIVQKAIKKVPGVSKVVVSEEKETAVVTFNDAMADIDALTWATTEAGYPSVLQADKAGTSELKAAK